MSYTPKIFRVSSLLGRILCLDNIPPTQYPKKNDDKRDINQKYNDEQSLHHFLSTRVKNLKIIFGQNLG